MTGAHDLEPQVIDLVNRGAIQVPRQPTAALRLQKLVAGGRYGTSDLARVVGEDQALAATLLRYANSAQYRGYDRITSLHEAITRIGASDVSRVAFAICLASQAGGSGALADLRRKWWADAYMAALCAQSLGERRGLRRDEAFVCGLLHDLGRMFAVTCMERVLADAKDARTLPASVWQDSIDRLHIELGVGIAKRWNLSTMLREAIAYHHKPESSISNRKMVDVVVAADGVVAAAREHPRLTSRDLSSVPTLHPEEVNMLTALVPQLALMMVALQETGEAGASTGEAPDVPGQIEKPPTALEGQVMRGIFELQVRRATGQRSFQGLYVTPDGLGFHGPDGPKESSTVMLSLTLDGDQAPLSFPANIVLSVGDRESQRIEAKLFGVDAQTLAAWNRFYGTFQ